MVRIFVIVFSIVWSITFASAWYLRSTAARVVMSISMACFVLVGLVGRNTDVRGDGFVVFGEYGYDMHLVLFFPAAIAVGVVTGVVGLLLVVRDLVRRYTATQAELT